MSSEEDKELKELVLQTLQKKGVINKVQAEIRASVFLALEENDVFKDKSPFINQQLKDYIKTSEGALVVSLVKEFLEFFNLEFTSVVFDPETHAGIDYKYEGRSSLAKQLSLNVPDEDNSAPLLGKLVSPLRNHVNPINFNYDDRSINQENTRNKEINKHHSVDVRKINNVENGSVPHSNTNVEKDIQDKSDTSDIVKLNAFQTPVSLDPQKNERSGKLPTPASPTGLSSLGGLPPLTSIGNSNKGLPVDEGRDVTSELKDILDFGLGDAHYEEDFNSPCSDIVKKPNRGGGFDSEGSEIEEEISSHSNDSPQADEVTVDIPVSKGSEHGDYLEDVTH